jgi:hypothetical protein
MEKLFFCFMFLILIYHCYSLFSQSHFRVQMSVPASGLASSFWFLVSDLEFDPKSRI